ncbi:Aste57867_20883 [Aphanomyces stellatus]|uniref:Aste57867_20883 protein n=1 Tax=Aphanomyces stellatus TaxID=120398 RepID=A0A485LG14_9STRA|nr:hypothetical protein As57867_020815 [Aphanomyces stellatus]VFT97560.1 Aste57867_20883 [Aphanomyces stellatus]
MAQPLFEHVAALLRDKTADIAPKEAAQLQERLQAAVSKLSQKIDEDPNQKDSWKAQKERGEALLKQWVLFQRQRLLQHEHDDLTQSAKVRSDGVKATHADVHQSMRRTKQALAAQIQHAADMHRRMGEGTSELKKTHERYAEVKEKLNQTQRLLKELNHQAYMDKVWIAAGMFIFTCVVLLIVVERFPRHYIPIFWLL